jgi:hypothetical protein
MRSLIVFPVWPWLHNYTSQFPLTPCSGVGTTLTFCKEGLAELIINKYTHSIVRKKLLNILLSIFLLFNFLNLPPESVEMLFPDFIFQTFPNPPQNQPRISALLSLNIFLRHCTPSFFLYNYCVILLFFLDWEIFANLRNAVIRFLHCYPASA